MLASTYIKRHRLIHLPAACLRLINQLSADIRLDRKIPDCAYILATIKHETADTYKPIAEYGKGKGRKYGIPDPQTEQIYYGRGYVQLTWKRNYELFAKKLDVDLVNHPDIALKPKVAYEIAVTGMLEGLFTGKKLSDYFTTTLCDYVHARQIINGMDKATLIASYAENFQALLEQVFPNI